VVRATMGAGLSWECGRQLEVLWGRGRGVEREWVERGSGVLKGVEIGKRQQCPWAFHCKSAGKEQARRRVTFREARAGKKVQVNLAEVTCCPLFAKCQKNIEPHYPVTVPGAHPGPGQQAGALQVLSYRAAAASMFVQAPRMPCFAS
jgi:hypothetical protein